MQIEATLGQSISPAWPTQLPAFLALLQRCGRRGGRVSSNTTIAYWFEFAKILVLGSFGFGLPLLFTNAALIPKLGKATPHAARPRVRTFRARSAARCFEPNFGRG